eukprot:SAG31_NODE_1996_length_6700_cov_4.398424_3_plen_50_part_00
MYTLLVFEYKVCPHTTWCPPPTTAYHCIWEKASDALATGTVAPMHSKGR